MLLDGFFRVSFFSICFLYLLKITPAKSYDHNIWNSLPGVLIMIMSAILCMIQILCMALNDSQPKASDKDESIMNTSNYYEIISVTIGTGILCFIERKKTTSKNKHE